MSTKVSISYDETYHFYEECGDDDNVYLQISTDEFEVRHGHIMVQIPNKVFREMTNAWCEKEVSQNNLLNSDDTQEVAAEWLINLRKTKTDLDV